MKRVFTPIDTIAGVPIERVKLYCMNMRGIVSEITSSIICHSIFIPQIYYYLRKDNGQPIEYSERYYYNYYEVVAKWNEIINYLICHEWHMRHLYNKKAANVNRTETGRFIEGNKCAYKATIPLELIVALHEMKMPITQIADFGFEQF